ncbi:hypothetical protein LTR85_007740 [Meristemomyces frigidus]|nr:hypothetical protein LTR85_007740 [Meristemomyces frigidus]
MSFPFLNTIVAQLWPNINIAASNMIKEIADPMFKSMLPAPLSTLHFTKVDLGTVPIKFSHAVATRTERDGIKLDLNLDWEGNSDMELDGEMIPALIGAAQISFVNPPSLKLDFTGAANIADLGVIHSSVCQVLLTIINGMATLPNRYLVPIDAHNDYFNTYLYPLGILRITVEKAWGFAEEAKSGAKKLFSKLTRASPDCYARVEVGAEEAWETKTRNNTTTPVWNEMHDFIVSDVEQCLTIKVMDADVGSDAEVGLAVLLVKEFLAAGGGRQELQLVREGKDTGGKVSVSCEYLTFAGEPDSFSAAEHKGDDGRLCGLATILVAGAFDVQGKREELKPSVIVTWGKQHKFQTAQLAATPGVDINNPTFNQNFRVPLTTDLVGSSSAAESFRIALMNGEQEVGGVDVPFADVVKAPNMVLQSKFDVGGGATVRASIGLRGVRAASMRQSLPARPKQ